MAISLHLDPRPLYIAVMPAAPLHAYPITMQPTFARTVAEGFTAQWDEADNRKRDQ